MRLTWRTLAWGLLGSLVLLALIWRPDPPRPAWAQGVGIFSRATCTQINSPVAGQTFCFDQTNALKSWDGTRWVRFASSSYANVLDYGAVCDGVANVATSVDTIVAAGIKRIFLPSGCLWVPTANTIPANLDILGEDWNTVTIQSSSPTTLEVNVGNNTRIQNARANTAFCYAQTQPINSAKFCPFRVFQNLSGSTGVLFPWPNQYAIISTGGTDQGSDDRPGFSITQVGSGDGLFTQNYIAATGAGIRAQQQSNSGYAVLVDRNSGGVGLQVDDLLAAAAGGQRINIISTFATSGQFLNVFHGTSAYNGDVITLNMANTGGSFGGNFLNMEANSVTLAKIVSTGGVVLGSATGDDKGLGTINYASGTFSNGLAASIASATGVNLMSVRGISATQTIANNLRGTCSFSASNTCAVAFARNEPDASYFVATGCPVQVGSKAVNGFTLTATTSNSNACDWILIH